MKLLLCSLFLVGLAITSLFVGVSNGALNALIDGFGQNTGGMQERTAEAVTVMVTSRIPRTIALILAGVGLSVSGLIMQMLARNKFVEPKTVGTSESAAFGLLIVLLVAPEMPIAGRMLVAMGFAMAGTVLFLLLLQRISWGSMYIVPLVGLMLGGVIEAATNFFAYRTDMMQALSNWTVGDFSNILQGRYELLWLSLVLTIGAYLAADRFTVIAMGETVSTSLGLNYRRTVVFGVVIVSLITAVVVVTSGMIPFVGLIVPNLVTLVMGDNVRRNLPWVALTGACLLLASDIVGRLILHPYELPVGTTMGVIGGAGFLALLLRSMRRDR